MHHDSSRCCRATTGPGAPRRRRSLSDARRSWPPVAWFFAANVLFAGGLFAHAFLYNFYIDALGLGERVMGGAAASLTAGGLAALLPAARLVDRLGPRLSYGAAAVVAGSGLLLGALVAQPVALYAAAFVAGAGTSTWRVVMGPALMRLTEGRLRARAFSWNVALLVATGAGWTAASAALPAWYQARFGTDELAGLRVTLAVAALCTLAAWLLVPRALRRATDGALAGARPRHDPDGAVAASTEDDRRPAGAPARPGFYHPRWLIILVAVVAVWMLAGGLVLPFFNVYFQREHDLSIARVGAIFAALQLLTAAVVAGSAEAAARVGPRRVLLAWAVLLAPALLLLDRTGSTAGAVTFFALAGFVPPATNPLIDQVLLERAPEARHGTVSMWRNAATELSGLAGAGLGGLLLEAASFRVLFDVAGIVAIAGAAGLMLRLRRGATGPDHAAA